jgi:magnesium transporter
VTRNAAAAPVARDALEPLSGSEFARVPVFAPGAGAGDVRDGLVGDEFEYAGEIAVVDEGRFVGFVPIERVLAAAPRTSMGGLVGDDVAVRRGEEREIVAARVAACNGRAAAVVDAGGAFLGVVPPATLIKTLFEEHTEDLERLGGSLGSSARIASEESVGRRLYHRLPWLAVGLAGAMISAAIVASFEGELEKQVLLAFFVPAVVYMADAVGTQTETIVIRGISLGVPIARIAAREVLTGLVIGVLVAVAFFAFAVGVWGDVRVAAVVSLSLLVSTSVATAVAMALPYALARRGLDPAFGSGPLATVIQDILSLAAYFAIAVALLP